MGLQVGVVVSVPVVVRVQVKDRDVDDVWLGDIVAEGVGVTVGVVDVV